VNAIREARIRWLANRLEACREADESAPDDTVAVGVCNEAIAAVREGNYGVGALIVDRDGRVLVRAHNQVFRPGFRSDGHAEMIAVDKLERELPDKPPASLTLYVSLEPCPMCLARLKLAGIGRVRYLSPDPAGGMVESRDRLPPIWRLLNPNQDFAPAEVSPPLRRLAKRIFQVNLRPLRRRLIERTQSTE
jgi:tRNA(adenine34) deaminase